MEGKLIFQKMAEIQKKVGAIKRDSQGQFGSCRSIADVYRYTHELFSDAEIISVPTVTDNAVSWSFTALDGTSVSCEVPVNMQLIKCFFDVGKMMSYTHKYAITTVFHIPFDDIDDPDTSTDVTIRDAFARDIYHYSGTVMSPQDEGYRILKDEMRKIAQEKGISVHEWKKTNKDEYYSELQHHITLYGV